MSFRSLSGLLRTRVFLTAVCYGVVALSLFEYIEGTMPASTTRLVATVSLAFGLPVAVTLAWVLSGAFVRRRARSAIIGALVIGALLWLNNTSVFVRPEGGPYLIAHRGVHQRMHAEHSDGFACVARIHPPKHAFIENTVPSIQAAFDYGARFVEIDIRETADGDFAVFHDDMLDCKTEARGPVAARTMAELRALDVGHGYFTESGEYPLRGKGMGMLKSLSEILNAFPDKGFIIDVKFGNDLVLWTRLIEYLASREVHDQGRLAVYGASRGVERFRTALPEAVAGSRESALLCARGYITTGWMGYTPKACRRSMAGTYPDTGWIFWGWPTKFISRMERAGTIVVLRRRGQTEPEFAASIPDGYTGGIQTDHIESFREWMVARPQ